jgi:hypothetical protein
VRRVIASKEWAGYEHVGVVRRTRPLEVRRRERSETSGLRE